MKLSRILALPAAAVLALAPVTAQAALASNQVRASALLDEANGQAADTDTQIVIALFVVLVIGIGIAVSDTGEPASP